MKSLLLYVVAIALAACGAVDRDDVAVRWLDYDVFVTEVQPVLAEKCGNPSCHGRAERAFSIYSHRNWRQDPAALYLPDALTSDELAHNYEASCVLVSEVAAPQETLLLKKTLGNSAGIYHGGGAIFDESDRWYRILLAWVEKGWTEQ